MERAEAEREAVLHAPQSDQARISERTRVVGLEQLSVVRLRPAGRSEAERLADYGEACGYCHPPDLLLDSHTGLRLVAAPHSPPAKRAPVANRKTCGERAPNTARMFIHFRLGLRLHARNSR